MVLKQKSPRWTRQRASLQSNVWIYEPELNNSFDPHRWVLICSCWDQTTEQNQDCSPAACWGGGDMLEVRSQRDEVVSDLLCVWTSGHVIRDKLFKLSQKIIRTKGPAHGSARLRSEHILIQTLIKTFIRFIINTLCMIINRTLLYKCLLMKDFR